MLSDTQRLREFAVRLLDAKRKDKRAQLYELPDGNTVLIQTSNVRQLMGRGSLFMHNTDYIVSVITTRANQIDSGVEVYLIPTDVVRQALETVRSEWLANPATITNKPDDDLEVLYFDRVAAGRADSFESKNDYATKWAQYRLSNSRLVEPRGFRLVSDQVLMTSPTMEGLVELLRQQAMTWSPSNSIEDYMQQVAARSGIEPWDKVRSDSVEHFIDDMVTTGKVSEFIKREYEWIVL